MADFPSIRTSDWTLFKQHKYKGQIKSNFENGAVQSRPRHTSSKWLFTIGWEWLTTSDYDTLVTFFDNNLGGSFNWTHIITGTVYSVRFSDDVFPEAEPLGTNYWKVTDLRLEEA